jgi:hypothetical protein
VVVVVVVEIVPDDEADCRSDRENEEACSKEIEGGKGRGCTRTKGKPGDDGNDDTGRDDVTTSPVPVT